MAFVLHLHPDEVVAGGGHGAVRARVDGSDGPANHWTARNQLPLGRVPDLRLLPVRELEAGPVVEIPGSERLVWLGHSQRRQGAQ